jgi:flagellar FliL protein
MVDQVATEEIGNGAEAEVKPGSNGKTIVLFVVLPILLLFGAIFAAYLAGLLDPLLGVAPKEPEEKVAEPLPEIQRSAYYQLPEMLVNLNTGGRKTSYLKISVSLELESEAAVEEVKQVLPRIIDNFQVYLRELRVEDLSGSAGLQRLREELLLRVNAAARPVVVRDVLFKEMLVQ